MFTPEVALCYIIVPSIQVMLTCAIPLTHHDHVDIKCAFLKIKGKPYEQVKWKDMLFIVNPKAGGSNPDVMKWAAYANVYPKAEMPFPEWWQKRIFKNNDGAHNDRTDNWGNTLRCFQDKAGNGYKMTAGNLKAGSTLCNTNLYFDVMDMDAGGGSCGSDEDSWGPTWNTGLGGGCPFDDPGVYSTMFGRTRRGDSEPFGARNLGFGASAQINGNGFENNNKNIQMFVR